MKDCKTFLLIIFLILLGQDKQYTTLKKIKVSIQDKYNILIKIF